MMTACALLMTACAQPPPGGGGMVLPTSGDDGPAVLDGGQTVADAGSANGDTTGSDVGSAPDISAGSVSARGMVTKA